MALATLTAYNNAGRKRSRAGPTSVKWEDLAAPLSASHPIEVETRRALAEIFEERKARADCYTSGGRGRRAGSSSSSSRATARALPRFHLSSKSNGKFAQTLRDATHERFVRIKGDRVLESDELENILVLLREHLTPAPKGAASSASDPASPSADPLIASSMAPAAAFRAPTFEGLNYDDFQRVGACLPLKAAHFFSPQTFLCFRRDCHGRISVSEFYDYVCRHRDLSEERINLSFSDPNGDGYMRENDLESYFFDFIQNIESLSALQEDFTHFYVFTAVRRFFFFLDRHGQRRLAIKDILASPVFRELQELRSSEWDEQLPNCQENWFSAHSSLRVYREYLELDGDQNGMLSKSELARFNNGSLTSLFIDRVWQEYRTYRNEDTNVYEMDYKQFLDFTLAMENQKTPQSIRWFWRLLDVRKEGRIDASIIKMFFDEVLRGIVAANQPVDVSCEDVCDEIFDMVKPADPRFITVKDLIKSGVGDTVISMLIDTSDFLSFEQHEAEGEAGT